MSEQNGSFLEIQRIQEEYEGNMAALRVQIGELVGSIDSLTAKIENLVVLHERVVKWLLIVVCAIALGKGMFDILEKFVA